MGIVIKNALALLPKAEGLIVGRHTLYLTDDIIAGIDRKPAGFVTDELIDGSQRLVIPGLINAHTHTYMSTLRNAADDLSFFDWLHGRVEPLEDQLVSEDAYWGSLLTQIEMIRSGTTCFNDMQMFIHQTTRAVCESGMRAVICRGLVGDTYDRKDWRIAEALEERDAFADCDRLSFRLGPHAPYSCGPDYLRLIADIAAEENMGIHIHISESKAENEGILRNWGKTPTEYVHDTGIFDLPTIAAHCVQTSASDHDILAKNKVSVVTNPASNMKLGNGFAPIPEMQAAHINICLGTDGAASNNAQNMFREMNLLALIHKGTHDDPCTVSATQTLLAATRNGAHALGLPTGSIEVGCKADLALLDLDAPSLTPLNNPLAALVYSANGTEVSTVIINGRVVMRDRELLTIDEERVRFEVGKICNRLGINEHVDTLSAPATLSVD